MQLFDHLPTPAVHLDSYGRILNVNSLAKTLPGWQNYPFKGSAFSRYLAQEDASLFNKAYNEVSEGQTLVFNATLLVDPERPVPVTIKASKTDSGDRIFLLNRQDTYTNGCGEKCLHAAILEAQYQHNPGGILLVNREREMISFNNEFVKMWGIPPEILESRDEGASLRYALEKKPMILRVFLPKSTRSTRLPMLNPPMRSTSRIAGSSIDRHIRPTEIVNTLAGFGISLISPLSRMPCTS
jgi:PAS domain-containing protein